jgi:hypothetical protein
VKQRCALWIIACLCYRVSAQESDRPFTVTWVQGRCVGCKVATDLNRVQWVSRSEGWGIGWHFPPPGAQGSGDYVVVHTVDAGRTWRELPDTWQHAVPPAFWFLNASD